MKNECEKCGHKPPEYERKKPEERREEILTAAIELSKKTNYRDITRAEVAEEAGVSLGLINRYFTTMALLRCNIIQAAIEREVLEIIFQGLAVSDPDALSAPKDLKLKALREFNSSL